MLHRSRLHLQSSFVGAIAIGDLIKTTLGPKGMVSLAPCYVVIRIPCYVVIPAHYVNTTGDTCTFQCSLYGLLFVYGRNESIISLNRICSFCSCTIASLHVCMCIPLKVSSLQTYPIRTNRMPPYSQEQSTPPPSILV